MTEHNTPLQQEILKRPLQKHGLLEELNLPPKAIAFLRKRKKPLLAGLFCLVTAVLAWSYYEHYTEERNDRAAGLLAEAMALNSLEERSVLLERIAAEYSRTGAAHWAKVELGHQAFADGDHQEALRRYEEVRNDISRKNPLLPLVQMSLAEAQENLGAQAEALAAYEKLAAMPGFAGEAYLAMARIHEKQGATAQAREMYGKALAGDDLPPELKELVRARLARI
jgi:predicted negative regulator of RcsB-dependent stress response